MDLEPELEFMFLDFCQTKMNVWATGATFKTVTANGRKVWLPQGPRELLRERERKKSRG